MICSNVVVDLNTGIEELPASPSASFLAHSGAGLDFARSPGLHSPHEIYLQLTSITNSELKQK